MIYETKRREVVQNRFSLVATLGKSEMSSGLSYVVFSRVRRFSDIAIDCGLTWDRLTSKISSKKKFRERVEYEKEILVTKSIATEIRYIENVTLNPILN